MEFASADLPRKVFYEEYFNFTKCLALLSLTVL